MRPLLVPNTTTTISRLLAIHKRDDALLFIVIFCTVLSLTPLLVLAGATAGFGLVVGILATLAITTLIVRWPVSGLFVVTVCATLIEESPLAFSPTGTSDAAALVPTPILTDHLYIFYWPTQLEGLIDRPIGFLFVFILLVVVLHRLVKREKPLQGGGLLLPFLFYLLCVAGGVLHGLASGGDFRIIVIEVRPFWYLFVSYLLAYNLVTRKRDIHTFFWLVILCAGVKGVQGVYIFLAYLHGNLAGFSDSILAHEDSFFFVALLLLVMLFCLHYRYRPQFYASLLVLPFVLVALVVNQRRADYVALVVGMVVAWTLIFLVKPRARKLLVVVMLCSAVLGTAYVAAFAHSGGGFAAPARAILAVISPDYTDTRDLESNLYRYIEDNDLKYTVHQYPLGVGFGIPYLQPIPLTSIFPQIREFDPYYDYIPHNTIYWVWMRLGPIGYLAFWYLVGAVIVRGSIIARRLRDPHLQLVAIYSVAVTFMEIIVAFADYQLFFFRNVIYLGLLAGILMKLPALDENEKVPDV
jgi:hypothetical protein